MRIVTIVTLLIAGCSVSNNSTHGTYVRSAELANEGREISEHEHECIRATVTHSNDQIARIASISDPGADTRIRMQMVANNRERELAQCKAIAVHEEDEFSAHERAEYLRQARQQRERNSLMSILTTSLRH